MTFSNISAISQNFKQNFVHFSDNYINP